MRIETGLTENEVLLYRKQFGDNEIYQKKKNARTIFINQIRQNPLIIVLTLATIISFSVGEKISSIYIFIMVSASIVLGFVNEYNAEQVVSRLLTKISHLVSVLRNGQKKKIEANELVVNDIVFVLQGDIVPADVKILESKDLEINESALTGESMPVEKGKGEELLMGSVIISGFAKCLVIKVGPETNFGKIVQNASFIKPQTDFQKGLTAFGGFLTKLIIILTIAIFAVNFLLGKSLLVALLFALAIAVGLTPELMPVIVTVSLSHGAGKLAKKKVIAKQLVSIENLGNMDILATDKTGTLTEGEIKLTGSIVYDKKFDIIESALHTNPTTGGEEIRGNPIEIAIASYAKEKGLKVDESKEIFEKPFDYTKRASFTVIKEGGSFRLIAKGAPEEIIEASLHKNKKKYLDEFKKLSEDGVRLIAVAQKKITKKTSYSWDDLKGISMIGFLTFMDVPKKDALAALKKFKKLNVDVKVLTGDNEIITNKICSEVGLTIEKDIVIGDQIEKMSEEEFQKIIIEANVFARLNPDHKLRIIDTLKKLGHVVGYLGDGINDIPSLHNSDVGISVDDAVDVAKDEADIVLLEKDLNVLADGITEGRVTFVNTIKYILMSTSSNFGNMFSAAISSAILPFLPMTPAQILLNNGLYDLAQIGLPSDSVDLESIRKPRHWNISFIRNYMVFFGPISSIYDFLTFGVMFYIFHARQGLFQTGWFIESLATQVLVVFVIRTSRTPFFKSKPGKLLTLASLLIVLIGVIIPFTSIGASLGFVRPPALYFIILVVMVLSYLALVEIMKSIFLKKFSL
ncbi:magnesium-translocating P-type ATPase [Candidatus Woesebacteria bacterium]|nr:magnesium-translocating P-type ATPase [Candidatus Woesebacteria bacterium]QQG47212.1 MAG: magnesium-translocating P-type ATPase [Candidatus Woesebacteria bacterium]